MEVVAVAGRSLTQLLNQLLEGSLEVGHHLLLDSVERVLHLLVHYLYLQVEALLLEVKSGVCLVKLVLHLQHSLVHHLRDD